MRSIPTMLLLCSPVDVQAMHFYVSNGGIDENPG